MTIKTIVLDKGMECNDGSCLDKEIIFDIEIPEIKQTPQATIKNKPQARVLGNNSNQVMDEPQIKENIIEKIIKVVPSYQPNFICKGANCNTKKNPAYAARPKGKCSNCGQFTKEDYGTCPWCSSKEIELLESDTLDELGIPTPENNKEDTDEAD